ncbi:hypothetical protein O1R50_02640 [Glycomyces luteolus]|uniref:Uncharacterized protein n=1 Tax=Glycomyces luteolus TaxID=2670330 RepID=A0A9X3P857_9ACTN|nr:hypothetical protein [Glycomyces luteolus]MDA1358500.1 hypothetical protein [Glycomyces luteolus]
MRGDEPELVAGVAQVGELLVGARAEQLGQLDRVREVHGLGRGVRGRRGGAPPVEVVPARSPGGPVELGDEGDRDLGAVGSVLGLEVALHGQLPAHLGLVLHRVDAVAHRLLVQGASGAGGEALAVVEDARAVDDGGLLRGLLLAVLVLEGVVDDGVLPPPVQLPGLGGQLLDDLLGALDVGFVGVERAVQAAAVGGLVGLDARAAALVRVLAEHAAPAGQQPGEIGPDHGRGVVGIEELDPFAVEVLRHLVGHPTKVPGRTRSERDARPRGRDRGRRSPREARER